MTTAEAAKKLKIGAIRVRVLIRAGRLPAKRIGRDWLIESSDLKLVAVRRPGRPKKIRKRA